MDVELFGRHAGLVDGGLKIFQHLIDCVVYIFLQTGPYVSLVIAVAIKDELVGELFNIIEANNNVWDSIIGNYFGEFDIVKVKIFNGVIRRKAVVGG